MNTPTPETDADDRPYPLPQYLQLIQFEGATVGVISVEEYESLYEKARKLERERDEAIKQIQVPGAWTCDKCGFGLTKSILHAATGNISANNEPFVERCPNDGVIMRPATYKEYAKSNYEGALKAYDERDQLRKACDELLLTSEMLMTVVCNSSGGDWRKETVDWQNAARRYVDEYYGRLKLYNSLPHVIAAKKGNEV